MPINYYSIQGPVVDELEIKKSQFITYLYPIQEEADFTSHLAAIRKDHYKATHHCQAYILGQDSSIQRMSDDGEPSGTAGLPMLEVLKQNQLTYLMAVVVRYFGGIKLGAGGLIRAYSTAVSEALKEAQIIKNVTQQRIDLVLDYKQVDIFNYQYQQSNLAMDLVDTLYGEQVTFQLSIDVDQLDEVHQRFMDRFSGQFQWLPGPEETLDIPLPRQGS